MTTEIYLYINLSNKILFLCQLLQKILLSKEHRVIILTDTEVELQEELSQTLWSAVPNSFLANEVLTNPATTKTNSPIIITSHTTWLKDRQEECILVNLTELTIENNCLNKIVFLFNNDANELTIAREFYRYYQKKQYPIKYFDMSKKHNTIKKPL